MAKPSRASNPQYHVQSLHEYVLAPLSAAASRLERERTEVATERDAFREFRERIADIEPAPRTAAPRCFAESTGRSPRTDALADVRSAYRETVMDVPHYESVYGEPLAGHAAAELRPELGHQLAETTSSSFTVPLREALRVAAQRAIDERQHLLERLDEEESSIKTARGEILELLRPLSTTVIPEWHRGTFLRRLDAIADRRQERLHARGDLPDDREYSLCTHLYDDAEWTYPVLTAVARVRETVTVGEGGESALSQRRCESL
ncbi:uncharacterized protein HHUB_4024 (plasmid) [Halobacterium hubeiense]|uniref:DUF7260 domain-containing protein n=1 Tax=Halobacterium hubeiense TaxID=1407499 RepID=A0A0U5H5F9_9EURY|nr:hypothetical protein [Halobacterium hubeiense]CQH63262.1 uncharacterized protein HHUB_4024 [Halobacterium hubeiense]